MTEKKRFAIMGRVCYYDSLIFDNDTNTEMGTSKVVDKLNEYDSELQMCREKAIYWRNKANDRAHP